VTRAWSRACISSPDSTNSSINARPSLGTLSICCSISSRRHDMICTWSHGPLRPPVRHQSRFTKQPFPRQIFTTAS
jgi:hypothetical protein